MLEKHNAQVKGVSLDKLLSLSKKSKGKKLFKIERKTDLKKPDIEISAVFDTENRLYISEQNLWYYRYDKSDKVFFDNDKHPFWQASYEDEPFKLYDTIFLGRYGCGGYYKYINIIKRAKNDLSYLPEYKEIIKQFNELKKELKLRAIDKIRAEFGICAKDEENKGEVARYFNYDGEFRKKDKDVLLFWHWFIDKFIDEEKYERKEKTITEVEQDRAFNNYVEKRIISLENMGFQNISK